MQPQTTLPPITSISDGVVVNGDMHHIKQEPDFEHSPSLPPIRTNNNNNNNNNNHSKVMSINHVCNNTESDYPEEVKEAAAVLENMKTLPPIANISQPQPLEPQTRSESSQLPTSSGDTGFISRLGEIPLVKRIYEQGTPLIKIGVAMVDQYSRGLNKNDTPLINNEGGEEKHGTNKDDALGQSERRRAMGGEISRSSSPSYRNSSRPHRTSQSSGSSNSTSYAPYAVPNSTVSATTSESSKVKRTTWQQMVIGTGAAVGAAGAAVSEESMKSLKYCLQWINYATQHIDAQIVVLKEFIVNLTITDPSHRAVVHTSSTSTLATIKKEVIDTLRKVIEVLSRFAGACLTDHAKNSVRNFILNLPTRWASMNYTEQPSPIASPQLAPANGHPLNQTTDYARRLLSLATESLEMLRSVAGIFGETVGRAETILKVVGFGGANTAGNSQYDNVWPSQAYSSSSTSSHSSSGSRSRRPSNSVRMNNHGPRKHSRPIPPTHLNEEDDDSILNEHDSDSSSDSDVESMRMEMDNAQKRALKSANAKSQQQHANGILNKKRKKGGKKENRMDLS